MFYNYDNNDINSNAREYGPPGNAAWPRPYTGVPYTGTPDAGGHGAGTVPEGARPYVGGERAQEPGEPGAAPPARALEPEAPVREWSEPDYREAPVGEMSAYSPGIPNPADYSRHPQYGRGRRPKGEKGPYAARRWGFVKAACLALACILLGGAAAYGVTEYRLSNYTPPPAANTVVLGNPPAAELQRPDSGRTVLTAEGEMAPQAIYEMARNQVVGVKTEASGGNYYGYSGDSGTVASGSGFIISNDGYILTNHHVIETAYTNGYDLAVFTQDGTRYDAEIVGFDRDNDVAVLKIEASGLNAVTMGDSGAMSVGDEVYTVGDPLGQLDYTMTDGIVSALDRVIAVDSRTSISMFQISAAVNSGNSGGPVYDSKGDVIGIVSAKYKDIGVEGLGFAIPINDAVSLAEQLITNGYISGKAYFGIGVETVDTRMIEYYNLVAGAYVKTVEPGSCAEKAGLKVGDIITKLDDAEVTGIDTLTYAKKQYKAGDVAEVTIHRAGETLTLTVTFDEEERPSAQQQPEQRQPDQGYDYRQIIPFPW
jgi:serine protease Do